LLIDSLLPPIVGSTYLNMDMTQVWIIAKRWKQSTDSSKAYRNTRTFECELDQVHSTMAVTTSTL